MKNVFKPASLLLYGLTIPIFFIIGSLVSVLSGAAEGQGLAGGAIVLFYGVITAGIAFILALFVAHGAKHETIVLINKILGILFILAACIITYRLITLDKTEAPAKNLPTKSTVPTIEMSVVSIDEIHKPALSQQNTDTPIGLGFFKPNFYDQPVLYFYGNINLEKPVNDHSPYDSITFQRNKYNQFEMATAPPWLVPDHLKLDYDMLYFRIKSIGRDFLEVVGNKRTQQTTYVSRYAGKIRYWPDFLIEVNSVEFSPGKENKVRARPFDYAGEINTPFQFMRPIVIEQNWMMVELQDENFKKVGKGWIQWKKDNQLLITYSLLS